MSGTVELTIVGAGAFIVPAGGDRRRPYGHGDTVTVDEEQAERLIGLGVAARKGDEPEPENEKITVPEESTDEDLAKMNVADVLDFVGTDKAKAQHALDIEQGKVKPRSSLVEALTEILKDDEEEVSDDG